MFDLKTFRIDKGLTQRELARTLGVDHSTISKAENHNVITPYIVECLVSQFPELKGAIEPTNRKSRIENSNRFDVTCAPIINISTMLPTGETVCVPSLQEGCVAFYHRGDSTSLKSGDLVIARKVDLSVIPYGELVLVVTESLRVVRAIRNSSFEGFVRLENKLGDAIELKASDIVELYLVVAVLRYLTL